MTDEEILEGNKLIADFLSLSIQLGMVEHPVSREYVYLDDCLWNESWDLLIPIVEQIERHGYWCEIVYSRLGTTKRPGRVNWCAFTKENYTNLFLNDCYTEIVREEGSTKIEAVYKTVVAFIKWYKENK